MNKLLNQAEVEECDHTFFMHRTNGLIDGQMCSLCKKHNALEKIFTSEQIKHIRENPKLYK